MKTLTQINQALRRHHKKHYRLLFFCCFFSVLLITAYVTMMRSPTVLTILPEGGDSRKQVMAIFILAAVGCGVFVTYTAALFFKDKAKDTGIFLALGASASQLHRQLFKELMQIAVGACLLGAALGTPLAFGIWKLFGTLLVNSPEMDFVFSAQAYLFAGVFLLYVIAALFFMSIRFIRQTNIIDIVNAQRRSEPVHDVRPWYGIVGILLMAVGGFGGYILPSFCITVLHWYPPAWINIAYLPLFAGLYMLLLYTVIHGWRHGKNRYKDIITRSMMKFQGRQTVNNMLIITVLLAGAYFASFYAPMLTTGSRMSIDNRPYDYMFHYRQDQDMLTEADIRDMADIYNVNITDYTQVQTTNIATDGYEQIEHSNGTYDLKYQELNREGNFLSESDFTEITGTSIDVPSGKLHAVLAKDGSGSYMIPNDITRLTNPVTGLQMDIAFETYAYDDMLAANYYVLDDADYQKITEGSTPEWKEYLTVFNVTDVDASYAFARNLYEEIVRRFGPECEVADSYDRIIRQRAEENGETYTLDTEDYRLHYEDLYSSEFKLYWKYMPMFRIMDLNDFNTTFAVFLMLFVFISVICFAAVFVIAYTRCMTVAYINRQVYDDLKHLGAGQNYLYDSVRSQIGKVFKTPVIVGTVLMYLLYFMIMYFNDDSLTPGELAGLRNCAVFVVIMTLIIWGFYRFTLKSVRKILEL